MTEQTAPKKRRSLALAALVAITAVATLACGATYFEIPIETPIRAKLDVSGFSACLDCRLRRRRDRRRRRQSGNGPAPAQSAPVEVLAASDRRGCHGARGDCTGAEQDRLGRRGLGSIVGREGRSLLPLPLAIKDEKDLEPYERLFANTAYWKRIGEEYQNPLIVTGTVLFMPHSRSGFVSRDVEDYDSFGRRQVRPVRTYMERKGFILRPKFIFIDGRTGATIHSQSHREEVLYNAQQNTPALSSYFELMDKILPDFLQALSSQKIRGTRVLLK